MTDLTSKANKRPGVQEAYSILDARVSDLHNRLEAVQEHQRMLSERMSDYFSKGVISRQHLKSPVEEEQAQQGSNAAIGIRGIATRVEKISELAQDIHYELDQMIQNFEG